MPALTFLIWQVPAPTFLIWQVSASTFLIWQVPLDVLVSDMDWHHTCYRATYGEESERCAIIARLLCDCGVIDA